MCLDVAFRNVGVAIVHQKTIQHVGVITTEKTKFKMARKSDDNADCCAIIASALVKLMHQFNIQGIVAELPHGSQNAASAIQMGMATGVVAAVAATLQIPIAYVTEFEGKKATLNKRAATKEEMINYALNNWKYDGFPKTKGKMEHIADALAAYTAAENTIIVRMFG